MLGSDFLFVFWKNLGHNKLLSKFSDLQSPVKTCIIISHNSQILKLKKLTQMSHNLPKFKLALLNAFKLTLVYQCKQGLAKFQQQFFFESLGIQWGNPLYLLKTSSAMTYKNSNTSARTSFSSTLESGINVGVRFLTGATSLLKMATFINLLFFIFFHPFLVIFLWLCTYKNSNYLSFKGGSVYSRGMFIDFEKSSRGYVHSRGYVYSGLQSRSKTVKKHMEMKNFFWLLYLNLGTT